VIRLEAGVSTACFARLVGVPERSYRRWQQRQRQGRPAKGPWPAPARDRVEPTAIEYADRFPAWGHRKIGMLMRVDGHRAPDATVLRALRRSGRVQPIDYQAERRQLAEARRAAFVVPPSGPNQVWQLDFSESRPATAASGGSAGLPTTGQSSSSAGTSRRPRTTATRSRRSSRRSPRANDSPDARSPSCSSIA
jgi:hypothetical protein